MRSSMAVLALLQALCATARSAFRARRELVLENLALRQQVAVFKHQVPHPPIATVDRIFWSWLCGRWPAWRGALLIVKPETVVGWHRRGFRLFWRGSRARREDARARTRSCAASLEKWRGPTPAGARREFTASC